MKWRKLLPGALKAEKLVASFGTMLALRKASAPQAIMKTSSG